MSPLDERPEPRPAISLVLPGYNEEANLEDTVGRCAAELSALGRPWEIVIVDDGSTDRTAELADGLSRKNGGIRVIRNPINLGVGIGVLIGMHGARGEVVLHDSMDYPFDLRDLDKVLPAFADADVVIVARTDRSAHSPYRKLTSLVHYWLVRVLFGVRFSDMNFVQAYRREVLAAVRVKAKSPAFVTPELLIRARDAGFRIAEVRAPFHRRHRGQASYGRPRDILWTLADMLSFWLERRRPR
jgi:glycosyltransferase involved in cell wall biosynthesis